MFTGIVEAIGTVTSINKTADEGTLLTISDCPSILTDAQLGDSISVNGTCLTITALHPPSSPSTAFTVSLSPETLRRTNLSTLSPTSNPSPTTTPHPHNHVNLEPACLPTTRLGGHILQGHVDTTAAITSVRADGESRVMRFSPRDQKLLRGVVEKGFVGLDGASLTVTAVEDGSVEGAEEGKGWFEVMLIHYTQAKIVTAKKEVGDLVNVEVDMVGKYVEKSVRGYLEDMTANLSRGGGQGGKLSLLEQTISRMVDEKMAAGRGV